MDYLHKLRLNDTGTKIIIKLDEKDINGVLEYRLERNTEELQLMYLTLKLAVLPEEIETKKDIKWLLFQVNSD